MHKFFLIIFTFFLLTKPSFERERETNDITIVSDISDCHKLYNEIGLEGVVNYSVFEKGFIGYNKIENKRKNIITLIDFSKPSTEKRLYVIDIENKKLLFVSHVAHGRNSGENFATSFSNKSGSYQSSLGFYITENTYSGKNGYSLVLNGLEKGINDKAKERAIVIHGAAYANPEGIKSMGRLGRSFGCPTLPQKINDTIINTIKNGSLLYIYADNKDYLNNSSIIVPQRASL